MRKRAICIFMTISVLFSTFKPVFAAEVGKYVEEAERLKTIGVFQGTDKGFELDRQPTRLEGLVMMIRLLGKEADAKALSKELSVFTDVPAWGIGYVNYAYKNGLTKGIGNQLFGTTDHMNAKSYITFMLRALGYDDTKGDFTYSKAMEFAKEKGILSKEDALELEKVAFLRDHIAKISMTTLNAKIKEGSVTLLEKLVNDGAISKDQAKELNGGVLSYEEFKKHFLEVYPGFTLNNRDILLDYIDIYDSEKFEDLLYFDINIDYDSFDDLKYLINTDEEVVAQAFADLSYEIGDYYNKDVFTTLYIGYYFYEEPTELYENKLYSEVFFDEGEQLWYGYYEIMQVSLDLGEMTYEVIGTFKTGEN